MPKPQVEKNRGSFVMMRHNELGGGYVFMDSFAHANPLLNGISERRVKGRNTLVALQNLQIDLHATHPDQGLLGNGHEARADPLTTA